LDNSPSSPFSFDEYVLLSPSSINHDWTSRTICAIIAPKLAVPLLLRGPFLSHNCLVIDHESRTCIAKSANYDLLNPPKHTPQVKVQIPSLNEIQRVRKNVVKELKSILNDRHKINEKNTTSETPNVAGLLRRRIDTLAFIEKNKEQLDRLDKEMRRKYEDRFPNDIPHIDQLPTDIVHRIKLKDPNKIIQCR